MREISLLVRDLVVDRRIHKVYTYTLPALAICQYFVMYTNLHASPWWVGIAESIRRRLCEVSRA